jgi:hypothetical protein
MRPPNVLSENDLKSYADEHLQYEVNMLTMSVGILAYLGIHNNTSPIPWVINNGILNTCAMHARNLIDFLYSRSKGRDFPTDIIIQDYVTEDDISRYLVPISPLLDEALTKANKQVAHLSVERIDYERAGKEWKFVDVMGHIRKAFASIAPHIPPTKMSPELREKLSQTVVAVPVVEIVELKSVNGEQIGVSFSLRDKRGPSPENKNSA